MYYSSTFIYQRQPQQTTKEEDCFKKIPRSKYFPAVSFSYQCFRDCFLQTPSNHPKNSRGDEFYSPAESTDHLLFPSCASDYRYVSSWFDRSQPKLMCRRRFGPCPKCLLQVQGNQENHNSVQYQGKKIK